MRWKGLCKGPSGEKKILFLNTVSLIIIDLPWFQVTYATTYNPQGTVTLTDGSGLANVVVETGNQTSTTVVSSEDYSNVMHAIEVWILKFEWMPICSVGINLLFELVQAATFLKINSFI